MPHQESWESCSDWYDKLVGDKGHYHHQHTILPKLLPLLDLKKDSSLLDLGCGQGIFSRALPAPLPYVGVDLSSSLIKSAEKQSPNRRFIVADFTKPLPLDQKFSHALFLLSLQNVEDQENALKNASEKLLPGGSVTLVLNHPCFRIPRQSSWGVDEGRKLQYRRIDRYLSPLKIPIATHPGKKGSDEGLSFHYPLSSYGRFLSKAGLCIVAMEEWISDKKSEGAKAKMEDRARIEFPLFLALKAKKL